MYEACIFPLQKMLTNLERWLDKAVAFAEQKKIDPNTLLSARLAPDQFPLVRQIQASCDQAKFTAARLTGKEPPKHPDTEQTIEELRIRLRAVHEYLGTFTREDFEGAAMRAISLVYFEGRFIYGKDYLNELQLPNFYFHVTTAYSILRHNGVDLGKQDFLGSITTHPKG
jgi:hypothetical protein